MVSRNPRHPRSFFQHFFEFELPCHVRSWSLLGGFIASFPMVGRPLLVKPVKGAAYRILMGMV